MTTEERVRRLEREVRWTRVGGAVMAIALACVVLVGAGQDQAKPKVADEVRAKKFVLHDNHGRVRGGWSANGELVSFSLIDETNRPRAGLGLGRKGSASLFLSPADAPGNAPGISTVNLSTDASGHAGISIWGGVFQDGLDIGYRDARSPFEIRFWDRANKLRVEFVCPEDGAASFRRYGKGGKPDVRSKQK